MDRRFQAARARRKALEREYKRIVRAEASALREQTAQDSVPVDVAVRTLAVTSKPVAPSAASEPEPEPLVPKGGLVSLADRSVLAIARSVVAAEAVAIPEAIEPAEESTRGVKAAAAVTITDAATDDSSKIMEAAEAVFVPLTEELTVDSGKSRETTEAVLVPQATEPLVTPAPRPRLRVVA